MTEIDMVHEVKSDYEVIAVGGSWGGMDALIKLLDTLDKGWTIPLIVVLHRHKVFESNLVGILSKYLDINVKEVDEKESILPGYLYIAPRNYHVLIENDRTFSLCVSENVNYSRPSIDVLFDSVASVYKSKAIGILLTGANSDGSEGLKKISAAGGLTMVQDPEDAESPNMPLSALKIMKPDHIFTLVKMNQFLKNLILKVHD